MPALGSTPDEVVQLYTRAGGSWWLTLAQNRPAYGDTVELAHIPALEVPRDDTAWADAALGEASHLTGVTLPEADTDTVGAAWVLFNDEALTDPALARWFAKPRNIAAGQALYLSPEVLTIEFTPTTYA